MVCKPDRLLCSILISSGQPFICPTRRLIGHHFCSPRHGGNVKTPLSATRLSNFWSRDKTLSVLSKSGDCGIGVDADRKVVSGHWERTLGKKKHMRTPWPRPQPIPRKQTNRVEHLHVAPAVDGKDRHLEKSEYLTQMGAVKMCFYSTVCS